MGSLEHWIRTGHLPDAVQLKFNPWHDTDDGRFTFRGQGRHFGTDSTAGFAKRPSRSNPRIIAIGNARSRETAQYPVKAKKNFRGGGGSFGGGGATATGVWGTDVKPQRPHSSGAAKGQIQSSRLPAAKLRPHVSMPNSDAPRRRAAEPTVAVRQLPRGWRGDERNGYSFVRDEQARTQDASGSLRLEAGIRDKRAQLHAGKPDRRPTDEGGHFIGVQFGGPRDEFNHFAQNRNFNRSAYQKLEKKWASALASGKKVHVRIKVSYPSASKRPASLNVTFKIDGVVGRKDFANESGK